jgi:hypothetical protein
MRRIGRDNVVEDGIQWLGSRFSLEKWKEYGQRKALAFVAKRYAVVRHSDGDNSMEVFLPERYYVS